MLAACQRHPDPDLPARWPGLGATSRPTGAVFALPGAGALYVLIVTKIARGLQLILGAIGTLLAGLGAGDDR